MVAPARYRLVGSFRVALPPERAFRLFTPVGERDWVDGWDPRFPAADAGELAEAARDELRRFAEDYPAFLRSWGDAIAGRVG